MPLLLVALFIVVPLAELYVIVQVAQAIDILPTIGILLADSILGSLLLRSQGRTVWRRFNESLGTGRVPHREILDGVFVIFGGALLLTPGFLSDIAGVLLLFPPTRAVARRLATRMLARRVTAGLTGGIGRTGASRSAPDGGRGRRARGGAGPGQPFDVEGTATEHSRDAAAEGRTAAPPLER